MSTKMTPEAAARIQSVTAKSNGGTVPKGSEHQVQLLKTLEKLNKK